MKQWLHDFLSHPWVDCKEAADGADGRAECGKRRISWGPSRYRYRKSATAAPSVTNVPVALPSSIFDFVPGTSPSCSSKVCTLHGRTLYSSAPEARPSLGVTRGAADPMTDPFSRLATRAAHFILYPCRSPHGGRLTQIR